MFCVLKRTISLRRFFEYSQHMFWMRNKENKFLIRILIWRPDYIKCVLNVDLFVCFVALRPKSTAKVMMGQSVHQTTLFPGQA